jgi:acetoacetyl-CoA synthetase
MITESITAGVSTVEILLPIWKSVLQQPLIGLDDNFFDLGGDSSLAVKLFTEIAKAVGREFPPVTIYQAPTIAALADLLEQKTAPQLPGAVLLKSGSAALPAVFFAHGLGGSVIDLYQPVKHLETDLPVYGLQARGIDGILDPLECIEEMAEYHLADLIRVQPHGPYILIGYSLGGLVVLEIARRLMARGERVALVAMLDGYPNIRYLSLGQRSRLIARQVKQRISAISQLPVREALSYLFNPLQRGLHIFGMLTGNASYQLSLGASFSPAVQRARETGHVALTQYRPNVYTGKVKFVRAGTITSFPSNPHAVWSNWIKNLEVDTVPGDHLGIITTHYESLASVLSRYIKEAVRH